MSILVKQLGRIAADIAIKVAITVATAYLTDVVTKTTSKKKTNSTRIKNETL